MSTKELLISHKNMNIQEIEINKYPDDMPIINQKISIKNDYTALLRPKSLHSFMAAMFWFDAQAMRGFKINHLILPFIPGARQDRLNSTGDTLFTLKSIAEIINLRKFKSVTMLDPHSEVAPALINNSRIIHTDEMVRSWTKGLVAVVSPDAGAEKRAGAVARYLKLPLVHAWKTRDVSTGVITGFGLEDNKELRAQRVLVVDDMCDGGGTFNGLAEQVFQPRDIRSDLFITHGIFSKGTENLLNNFQKIYCTDSILGDKPGIEVINICEQLLVKTRGMTV